MDILRALDVATDEFGRRLALVRTEQWSLATPCSDWDVRYLVAHVVGGNRFTVMILGGASAADAIGEVMSQPQLGDDPLHAWAATSAAQTAAFGQSGALERLVDHPLGTLTGGRFLELRLFDVTLHAWDLARSLGVDERLDPQLVDVVLSIVESASQGIGFGITPLGVVGPTAVPQVRLLGLTGRAG